VTIVLDPTTPALEPTTTPSRTIIETWKDQRRQRVADAAAVLDEHKPGWYKKVSTETLDLHSHHNCVLGQVFRPRFFANIRQSGYGRGYDFLSDKNSFHHPTAFCSNEPDRKFWIEEIEKRKAA